MNRAQLIEAAKSLSGFWEDDQNLVRVVPPHEGSKEDYKLIGRGWGVEGRNGWNVILNETTVAEPINDGDVVIRALVLEALQR